MQPSLSDRFWSKVHKTESCWLWTGAVQRYGAFNTGTGTQRTHRVAWELTNGPIPDGASVCHRCDTPTCVNPSHLFLGTQADNLRDMAAKGRGRGRTNPARDVSEFRRNHNAKKLNADDVLAIRRRAAQGERVNALSRAFSVSHSAIVLIVQRVNWRWLEDSTQSPLT